MSRDIFACKMRNSLQSLTLDLLEHTKGRKTGNRRMSILKLDCRGLLVWSVLPSHAFSQERIIHGYQVQTTLCSLSFCSHGQRRRDCILQLHLHISRILFPSKPHGQSLMGRDIFACKRHNSLESLTLEHLGPTKGRKRGNRRMSSLQLVQRELLIWSVLPLAFVFQQPIIRAHEVQTTRSSLSFGFLECIHDPRVPKFVHQYLFKSQFSIYFKFKFPIYYLINLQWHIQIVKTSSPNITLNRNEEDGGIGTFLGRSPRVLVCQTC